MRAVPTRVQRAYFMALSHARSTRAPGSAPSARVVYGRRPSHARFTRAIHADVHGVRICWMTLSQVRSQGCSFFAFVWL